MNENENINIAKVKYRWQCIPNIVYILKNKIFQINTPYFHLKDPGKKDKK